MSAKFLALGGAHWDILGRASVNMGLHDDVGGRIRRLIGGVAGPVAMKLGLLGAPIQLIGYAGHDQLGDALLNKLAEFHIDTEPMIRGNLPTDVYMGIEAPNGLIAAIADCHSLEAHSADVVERALAICDGNTHLIVDGNLHEETLFYLAEAQFSFHNMTLIPASPGKVDRLAHFIGRKPAQLIVNLREANALTGENDQTASDAAMNLLRLGFGAALVSNGAKACAFAHDDLVIEAMPPDVEVKRFTGAGDTLAGHFLYAQSIKMHPEKALVYALEETAQFISVEDRDA